MQAGAIEGGHKMVGRGIAAHVKQLAAHHNVPRLRAKKFMSYPKCYGKDSTWCSGIEDIRIDAILLLHFDSLFLSVARQLVSLLLLLKTKLITPIR